MKRFVSLLICLLLLASALPLTLTASAKDWTAIRGAYNKLVEGIKNFEEKIDISEYHLSETVFIHDVYYNIGFNEPLLFNLENSISWYYGSNGSDIGVVLPKYCMTESTYKQRLNYVNTELDRIIDGMPQGLDKYEQALYLHDYCATNFSYDPKVEIRDIYTMLVSGYGVCEGYTLLYDALLTRVGIESYGVYAESINHIWNAVKLYGEWYHVDVTWDDPVMDTDTYQDYYGSVWHTYFLVSDASMRVSHCDDYIVYAPCDDTTFDNASISSLSFPVGFANGRAYTLKYDGIYELNLTSGSMYRVSSRSYQSLYFGSFDDRLIYFDYDTFYAYDPLTGGVTEVLCPETYGEDVLGFYLSENILHFATNTVSSFDGSESYYYWIIPAFDTVLGDVNSDGSVGAADYTLLKRVVLGTYSLPNSMVDFADINSDGKIDATDYALLKRVVLGTYKL